MARAVAHILCKIKPILGKNFKEKKVEINCITSYVKCLKWCLQRTNKILIMILVVNDFLKGTDEREIDLVLQYFKE